MNKSKELGFIDYGDEGGFTLAFLMVCVALLPIGIRIDIPGLVALPVCLVPSAWLSNSSLVILTITLLMRRVFL